MALDVQSMPLTYRFAYIIGSAGNEIPLVAHPQLTNFIANVPLPAGLPPFGTVFLVVDVTDFFGAVARGTVDADRVSVAVVNVTLPAIASDTVVNYTLARLADVGSHQQSSAGEVARLGAVSEVVVGSLFPCAYVNCGYRGRCVRGGCFCPTSSVSTVGTHANRTVYVSAPRNDSTACNDTSVTSSSLFVKLCPGSGIDLNSVGVPSSECSGHGVCVRSRSLCMNADIGCTVHCYCAAGWAGASCSLSEAQAASARDLQLALLNSTVCIDSDALLLAQFLSIASCEFCPVNPRFLCRLVPTPD